MFLWVELVIGSLQFCFHEEEVLAKTKELPTTLQEA
jgi:hypothetical protein